MKFPPISKNPLDYLIILLAAYSIYDYMDHIGRKGSVFEKYPTDWLIFSISAFLYFVIVLHTSRLVILRVFKSFDLLGETSAVGLWLISYLTAIGPMLDRLLWLQGELIFRLSIGPLVGILLVYFIARVCANLLLGKNWLYSK